jgi:hypothetical protein
MLSKKNPIKTMLKIVYFDEESASDYLDVSAGGKEVSTSENIKKRARETHGKVETGLSAKLSWLPFFGASADIQTGASTALAGNSILQKTLSNTILTDYLVKASAEEQIVKIRDIQLTAPEGSMAYIKMFTPYMIILNTEEQGIDLSKFDAALTGAKGYYEMLGNGKEGEKCVLRFNIRAFRNNYGLADLSKMKLVFHGIAVGETREHNLTMEAEMHPSRANTPLTANDIVDGKSGGQTDVLKVYDILLAGIETGDSDGR